MHASWRLMNPRESVWNLLYQKIMKITSRREDTIRWGTLKKTQCKGSNISQRKWKIHFSSRRWTNQICRRRSGTENIHLDTGSPNSRRRSKRFSWRIRRVSSSTTSRLTSGCRWSDKWFLVHIRKLHTPPSRWTQSQTLLVERRIIPYSTEIHDVSRTTRTNLDVMQESRIDDNWNIDGSRDLSDSWTGFTQFTPLDEKPPDGFLWSGRRLTKRQLTSRPDHLWPELWRGLGRNAEPSIEKPKLDNARRLRGIYFTDPEDKEFRETFSECSKEVGNTNGSCYALQDMQEK